MGHRQITILTLLISIIYLLSCQTNPYKQGEWLYKDRCANCHMEDGSGLGAQIPALAASSILVNDQAAAVCLVYNGITKGDPKITQLDMPSNKDLTSADLANLINFINSQWHPNAPVVQDNDIDIWLTECEN